ncbi:MAG TPA: DCC1-like thiol-disulfide oxidoreductase family protein [Chitinophagaceae bacterium]|jgi:predicted DCC family thiol-disulfide oxidoreductase YuxK|nr:DCC1-like thiol-disulfide oxidoreductase family protein [Niabella sp.]HUM97607.1 DCC1-like thiol-disulfide oxidoreductase family protein [Chitinophagaceae bacterium]
MTTDKPIILFDGVCNFCNRMVNFAIRNDKKAKLLFSQLQSPTGEQLKKEYQVATDADTIVFIEKGKAYTYARAAIRVCRYLNWPAKLLYAFVIVPRFISQPVYKWIARNRYKWFGKKDSCMIPTAEIKKRFLE